MHKPESFRNGTYEINKSLNPGQKIRLALINKKITSGFCCSSKQSGNERKRKARQILEFFQRAEVTLKHEGIADNRSCYCP